MGLRVKKETIGEIAAAAQIMREFATKVRWPTRQPGRHRRHRRRFVAHLQHLDRVDVRRCRGRGAGGQARRPLGVVEFRRADVLEAFGANINLGPDKVAQCLAETGIGFMFAPNHHAAMKHAAPVRKELGVRTIFNILGPLTNPAGAPNQLLGVFHPDLVGIQVRVLERLGSRHVLVVYGKDGMDEVSLGAATMVGELKNGEVREYEIHPEDFGLSMVSNRGLRVGNAGESRAMVLEALENTPGTPREIVVLNAGVALYAADVAGSIDDGIRMAREAIASGAAKKKARCVRRRHAEARRVSRRGAAILRGCGSAGCRGGTSPPLPRSMPLRWSSTTASCR
jgi:anthranilate phosphoribosyltransferase